MNLKFQYTRRRESRAFTIVEVIVCSALLAVMLAAFYTGIASGFSMVDLSRQNLRANQIVVEKMETIRLYTWDQINSNGFIPSTFTAPFYPPVAGETNSGSGITYYGAVLITNAPVDSAYATNMKLVRVTLVWTNKVRRTREMETLVSEFGIQNYIY